MWNVERCFACCVQGIGDDDAVESSSRSLVETVEGFQAVYFTPRPLSNLSVTDTLPSLAPITNMQVRSVQHDLHLCIATSTY